jgi:glycosyltransferase involved in cell wall biosynthesis
MMPYSTGFAGLLAQRACGVPLVFNFDDSPTCLDQNPTFASPLHYAATRWMEDLYVRRADAVAYVSRDNLERVRARQAPADQSKLHLIRYGATSTPPARADAASDLPLDSDTFNVVYVGGMSGWSDFVDEAAVSLPKRLYRRFLAAARYRLAEVDHRPHGPVYLGQAVRRLLEQRPEWAGRVRVHFFGRTSPHAPVDRVLREAGIRDLVTMHGAVDHSMARRLQVAADCLFMSLPARADGAGSSIISSKTYEYLQTDRPILAALPPGENATYLRTRPGVFLTPPADISAMAAALNGLVHRWMEGGPDALAVDRRALQVELGSQVRARAFDRLLRDLVGGAVASSRSPSARPLSLSEFE